MRWENERACSAEDERLHAAYGALMDLVASYLQDHPDDHYLRTHLAPGILLNQVRCVRWYLRWLPHGGRVLDWGCRFAPDSFLIRRARPALELHGCDLAVCARYRPFHEAGGVEFRPLTHPVVLPYPDGHFDAVIGAGVLEHVPHDYESLKEVHRVLKPLAPLVITHLPYRRSRTERRLRAGGRPCHRRLYTSDETARLLLRSGLCPLKVDYLERTLLNEVRARRLSGVGHRVGRACLRARWWLADRLRPRTNHDSLCAVADKREEM